ncbi:hypothetical protein U1Q18_002965 [Sarracenia purpurea var. burkii]
MATAHQRASAALHRASTLSDSTFSTPSSSSSTSFSDNRAGPGPENRQSNKAVATTAKIESKIINDRETGRSRGFGFVIKEIKKMH